MLDKKLVTPLTNGVRSLFKFQRYDGDWLSDLIIKRRLYGTNPTKINDPFDCNLSLSYESLNDTQKKQLIETIDKKWKILCFSTSQSNTLLWSHYADKHKGICIEFDIEKDKIFQCALKVQYEKKVPNFGNDLNDYVLRLITKSDAWEYEDEYRILAYNQEYCTDSELVLFKDDYISKEISIDCIKSIYLGVDFHRNQEPESAKKHIQNLVNEHAPHINIIQMKIQNGHYGLKFDESGKTE